MICVLLRAAVINAMNILAVDHKEQDQVWQTVAGILHLGNVFFEPRDPNDPESEVTLPAGMQA